MTAFLLLYEYVEDVLERRGPYREEHLARIRELQAAGQVSLAGALGDPPNGGAIAFVDVDQADVERFAQEDPYVRAGVVSNWRIEPWTLV